MLLGSRWSPAAATPSLSLPLIRAPSAPSLGKAQKAGVVVNIDNKPTDATLATAGVEIPFVGPDNREGARMVGAELAKHLRPGDGASRTR